MARKGLNIYKRKDNRYEGRYIKSYDINGKAVYGYVYSKSYTDAKDKLIKCKSDNLKKLISSSMTLSEWLNTWIETNTNIKESTKELYKRHIKNNIIPKIGKISLKKLSNEILQSFVLSLQFSPSTVKLIFSILKSALICAEDKELVFNIWDKVKLPKKIKSEITILTLQEQRKLESVLSDENDIGILICLYMGLRIGELCALKWDNIDFINNVVYIKGTQTRINGKLKITEPKSKASLRMIPIPDILLNKLKSHKNNSEFVLSNNNKMIEVRAYRRQFKKLLKKAELPDINFIPSDIRFLQGHLKSEWIIKL